MYSPSDTGLGMAWGGSLFTSVSNTRYITRYSNHQEIVNRRPEQMYTSFGTRLEWPREGSLFELDLNKRRDPKRGHCSSQLLGHY